jgi:hypothetical protein
VYPLANFLVACCYVLSPLAPNGLDAPHLLEVYLGLAWPVSFLQQLVVD